MTDVLEKSYDDPISQNKYPLKIDISGNIGLSNIKLEDMVGVSSAAWMTPSPSPVLGGAGKVKVLPKAAKKMASNHDACKVLYRSVPPVRTHFRVIKKIGSGTFSNVYLAKLKALGENSPEFALKHIYSISHPKRIADEIKCLHEIGGSHHVIGIETCIRYKGEFVIVMPYQRHSDFTDLLNKMDLEDVRVYMRQLLTALFRVHQHNVIHRDVKPNNFLFDLETRQSGLVDFGLSQYIIAEEKGLEPTSSSEKTTSARNPVSPCKKRSPVSSRRSNASPPTKPKRKCLAEIQPNNVPVQTAKKPLFSDKKSMDVKSRKMERFEQSCNAENLSLSNTILSRAVEEKFKFMSLTSPRLLADRSRPRRSSSVTIADVFPSIRKYTRSRALSTSADRCKSKTNEKSCNCFGKLSVCYKCLARPSASASRAGTPGFRSPEVLLRYSNQTTAVDIWSAGVIFLTLLCGRCPFFRPCDDVDSLAQLVLIFGNKKMQEVARVLGRKLTCSQQFTGYDLRGIVTALRRANHCDGPKLRTSPQRRGLVEGESPRKSDQANNQFQSGFEGVDIPDSAFDLLKQMLDPNPHTRITALKALYHDFLITDEKKVFISPFKSPAQSTKTSS